ncbi:FAD-dependent monooxygenase [Piscinibacter sakaiensis]|uniref:FAD-dependent monooxygenase n=1 Tax=Piscinibacter sakaiensis TaxID=1547922 RepID=UPI003AAC67B0
MTKSCDVEVRGAGVVGCCLALSLARLGLSVRLRGAAPSDHPPGDDVRAFALNAASVALLRGLKVWDGLPADAATAVREMAIHGDDADALLEFSAWQQRIGELAWIVDAAALESALANAVRFAPHIERIDGKAEPSHDAPPRLTALCEGQSSASRDELGITLDRRPYGHRAIAARLQGEQPHQGRARQWFRAPDVLALLPFDRPMPGSSWALVWSMPDAQADELLALDDRVFSARLSDAVGEPLQLASPRASWPLARARAEAWCGPGWVLLGDAAHVVHPLAGQGLNLGLADVATLSRVIATREPWRGIGEPRLLRRFERERAAPTWAMTQVTDGLLHLFAHPDPLVRMLRNRGLGLVNRAGSVKRWLAGQALDS